jgi:hypothetical protein
MKPSKRINSDVAKLRAFQDAYLALLEASVHQDAWPYRTFAPKGDQEIWFQLRTKVAQTAGPAGIVYGKYGAIYRTQSGPYVNPGFHPIVNWEVSIKDADQFSPLNLQTALDAAIANADSMALEAADREKGLIGLLAKFIRIPADLREAVGEGSSSQKAATYVGRFSQVVIGLLVTWLGALIPYLIQKLIQNFS